MKVIKPPTDVNVTEETCKVCGAILELNPWDYKEKSSEQEDPFDSSWHTIKRKWYNCMCCNSINVVKTVIDGEVSKL